MLRPKADARGVVALPRRTQAACQLPKDSTGSGVVQRCLVSDARFAGIDPRVLSVKIANALDARDLREIHLDTWREPLGRRSEGRLIQSSGGFVVKIVTW